MISTSQALEEIIKQSPLLESALAEGIVNYSSLARILRPKIEKKLFKNVKEGAIVMALKRISVKFKKTLPQNGSLLSQLGDITIRSNLVEYTFLNSLESSIRQSKILQDAAGDKDVFITISHGVGQVTIIASAAIENEIIEVFKEEKLISTFKNLSSLTIKIPIEATKTPGGYYSILKYLAWEGINIIEVVSTFTELTIVLESKYIDKAFTILKNLESNQ